MKLETTKNAKNKTTKNSLQIRQAIAACLILCSLMICLMASPFTQTQSAATKSMVQPRPTPPNDPLDEAGLTALVEKLKASLAESVQDEDAKTSITEKWDARMEQLAGMTAKQVVDLFLADVKSVVNEEDVLNQLNESFMTAAS